MGDVASQELLDLVPERPPLNGSPVPNYDTDRDQDPGLMIARTAQSLETDDAGGVQTWRFPATVTSLMPTVVATMYVQPTGPPLTPPGRIVVRAGVFDCDEARTACTRLEVDTVSLAPTLGVFVPVVFDLSSDAATTIGAGRRFELRVALVADGSTDDAWIAYDSTDAPALLTMAP